MEVENLNPYGAEETKARQVERMFDSIAPAYDRMNTAMTFGLHRRWRDKGLKMLGLVPGARVLDVATGTGDVAFKIYETYAPRQVTGVDLSHGMLEIAREKLSRLPKTARDVLCFGVGDSLSLAFPDNSFDAVTVAYGVRNFEHLGKGLREMCRVLRPGGKLCVIELSEPSNPLTRSLYRFYANRLIPFVGGLVSGDREAYAYLPKSVARAPQRDAMTALMLEAGLGSATWKSLTFGAVCIYIAVK